MELWTTPVQSDTHSKKPSITFRSPHRMQVRCPLFAVLLYIP